MTDAVAHPPLYATFSRRFLGLCVDVAFWLLVVTPLTLTLGSLVPSTVFDWVIYLVLGGFFLYEPIMLPATGGTLGHHLLNLRVSRGGGGSKVGFLRALLRVLLKGGLGLFSFLLMAFLRRNQAFHDKLTGTCVQLKDPLKAMPGQYTLDPAAPPPEMGVSRARRLSAVLAYGLAVTVLWALVPWPFISAQCRATGPCTPNEQLLTVVMGLVWFAAAVALLVVGWRGQLPGAKAKG